MFLPAHVATGYIVGKGAGKWTGIPIAFLSHPILDMTWQVIYHGPLTVPMLGVLGVASVLVAWFGRRQWPCMLAAVALDVDRLWGTEGGAWNWAVLSHPWMSQPWFSVGIQAGFALLVAAQIWRKKTNAS